MHAALHEYCANGTRTKLWRLLSHQEAESVPLLGLPRLDAVAALVSTSQSSQSLTDQTFSQDAVIEIAVLKNVQDNSEFCLHGLCQHLYNCGSVDSTENERLFASRLLHMAAAGLPASCCACLRV